MEIRFADLEVGDSATVAGYQPGSNAYRARLLAMGLTRGTVFRLVKLAPLGDPVEVEVRGFNLSLRRKEAEVLLITRPAPPNQTGGTL